MPTASAVPASLDVYAWPEVQASLDQQGWAMLPGLLDRDTCDEVSSWYDTGAHFRSRVVMARHGFGQGEYQYFAYPLPPLVATLRETLDIWHGKANGKAAVDYGFHLAITDLPDKIREHRRGVLAITAETPDALIPLAEVERRYVRQVLAAVGGNKTMAAKVLGIDRRSLYRRLDGDHVNRVSPPAMR